MVATKALPAEAKLVYLLNLLQNKRAFWIMQIAGVLLFFAFGWLFGWLAVISRADFIEAVFVVLMTLGLGIFGIILFILSLLSSTAIAILMHELIHGAFFWIFSRSRPNFGIRTGYAYAAAPGWFFPRWQYVAIGLAPLVLMSVAGMILVAVAPIIFLPFIVFGMIVNAGGAAGDMWIVYKVIRERGNLLIEDLGDGFNMYAIPSPG
jgi:hypothetical protein